MTNSSGGGRLAAIGWFIVLVAGQAASLALMQAGTIVGYTHYQLSRLAAPGLFGLALVVLVLQLATVLVWGRGAIGTAVRWLRERKRLVPILVGTAFFLLLGAAASRDIRYYVVELTLAAMVQGLALVTALRLVQSWGDREVAGVGGRLGRFLGPSTGMSEDRGSDRWVWILGFAVTGVCALLAVLVYERVPHVPDEIVYLLQARYFAAGKLQLPAPPVPAAFDVDLLYYDASRVFVPTPPGWPAILAIGVRLGAPWLVNPVLAGVSVLLFHALMRRVDAPRTARLATLLLASSPWFLFLGMSFMTHIATLTLALGAALGIAIARERGSVMPALAAGAATGCVGLIRPLEGLAVAVVLGLWSLGARHRAFRLLPSAALTAATIAVSLLVRPYNTALTGSASRFPIMMYVDRYYAPGANDLGFGPNRGMGWGGLDPWPGHGWRDALLNTTLNGFALQSELFAWACGSLLLIVGLVAVGRLRRSDVAMMGIVVLVVGLHAFYWFSGGPDFGARYWFLIIVPCIALTARAPAALFTGDAPNETRAIAFVLALSASALLTFVPWRSVEKYHHFRSMGREMQAFADTHPLGRALVLVRGRRHPDYHQAALQNAMDLTAPATVYAWDRTAEVRRAVVAAFPDRPVWIVDGPTITDGAFRVVAGPLPPGSVAPAIPSSVDIPKVVGGKRTDGIERRTP